MMKTSESSVVGESSKVIQDDNDESISSSSSSSSSMLLWTLAPEMLFSIFSFVDGRTLSSFVEAFLSSESQRFLVGPFVGYLMKHWHDKILQMLSNSSSSSSNSNNNNKISLSQPALISFVKANMIPMTRSIEEAYSVMNNHAAANKMIIREFSKWCLLFDYVQQGPRSSSSSSTSLMMMNNSAAGSEENRRRRMVWPMGVGVFAARPMCGNAAIQTKVVVHCPVWNPMAIILCQDVWLASSSSPKTLKTTHDDDGGLALAAGTIDPTSFSWLPSEGDIDGFIPDENIGFLTPYDENNIRTFRATKALTRDNDCISAMGRPDSCLSILPSLDCPIYGSLVDQMIRSKSNRHSWMLEKEDVFEQQQQQQQQQQKKNIRGLGGRRNHHHPKDRILCFFDSHPKYSGGANDANLKEYTAITSSSNHSDDGGGGGTPLLVERIIHLMKSLQPTATSTAR